MERKRKRKRKKALSKKEKNSKRTKINKGMRKLYIGFSTRLIFNIFMFIILLVSGLTVTVLSLDFTEQESINYSEKSNLDYKVYLKKNEFYDQDYLGKNMIYIASLIDKVNIDFNYIFTSDENINLDFDYKIIGKLSITDSNGKNSYFEKEYLILSDKKISMKKNKNQVINESINIDYGYYNSLANKFKSSYGVDTISNFTVNFIINKNNSKEEIVINDESLMSISIPLSEKSVNIFMDYKDINNTNSIISDSNIIIDNVIYMIIGTILIIFALIMFTRIISLLKLLKRDRSKYDKYISKLLNEYDRLIVETSTCPTISGDNVIRIDKFEELLDVRDNLKLPIMYYVVAKHQKCYFYIIYENKIYLNVVKAIDLTSENNKTNTNY